MVGLKNPISQTEAQSTASQARFSEAALHVMSNGELHSGQSHVAATCQCRPLQLPLSQRDDRGKNKMFIAIQSSRLQGDAFSKGPIPEASCFELVVGGNAHNCFERKLLRPHMANEAIRLTHLSSK